LIYKYQAKFKNVKIIILLLTTIYCCQLIAMQLPKSLAKRSTYNIYAQSASIIDKPYYEDYLEQKLVAHYVNSYLKGKELYRLVKRSKPFLKHVINELEKRNLPRELALLPIVESAYRPLAVSNKGATGIWQISYVAGRRYGLIYSSNDNLQDHRHDLVASTNAALSYLEFLYEKFDNDWLLALAAYNAGEGRVSRAIKNNKFTGENVNYWTLPLPKETRHYIPKLLALSIIFKDPKRFGLNLDSI
jgi:membrane-bound lytic murein transglycosylase D